MRTTRSTSDQSNAPLARAVWDYVLGRPVRLHMPGHKGRAPRDLAFFERSPFVADLTELPGLDNLHAPGGPIHEAQRLAAAAFGADDSFFLVNGSTAGIHAMIMASCGPGDEIVIPRDAHVAAVGGLVLSGARPVYVPCEVDEPFGIPLGVTPDCLSDALERHPRARAVLLTSPNYYGVVPAVETLVALAHGYGKIALVDEAHGAHLPFHEGLPPSALAAGADAVVSGAHKTLGALTQAAFLNVSGGRIDRDSVRRALRLIETTSPSYLLMASLDVARRLVATRGRELLDRIIRLADDARGKLDRLPGVRCLRESDIADRGFRHDPTKLLVGVRGSGMTGFEVARRLRSDRGVQVELADAGNILAILTILDTEADVAALTGALEALVKAGADAGTGAAAAAEARADADALAVREGLCALMRSVPRSRMAPRDAVFSRAEWMALGDAAGRVAQDAIVAYPPGIPLVFPGDEISEEAAGVALRALRSEVELLGVREGRVPVVSA